MADHSWAVPVMRAGYFGRGATYLAVAGLSLWAIWRGGEAKGTSSAMESLSTSAWGLSVLWIMALGLLAYAVWRIVDAAADLEDHGLDAHGIVARTGMTVTGLLHGGLGLVAVATALGLRDGSGGIPGAVGRVLDLPGGRWILAAGALVTIGTSLYYLHKAWTAGHRKSLMANHFTRHWDWMLRAGVAAQGVIVLLIGIFLGFAALGSDASDAGGLDKVFDWLKDQPFGNALVNALCLGLVGFAFFCFVNAAWRIIPKVSHGSVESLADRIEAAVSR